MTINLAIYSLHCQPLFRHRRPRMCAAWLSASSTHARLQRASEPLHAVHLTLLIRSTASVQQLQLCDCHEQAHLQDPYFNRCVVFGPYFAKYGDNHGGLYFRLKTQVHLFSSRRSATRAPCSPEVVAYFSPEERRVHLVTEHIDVLLHFLLSIMYRDWSLSGLLYT